jgi:hypothetical protein
LYQETGETNYFTLFYRRSAVPYSRLTAKQFKERMHDEEVQIKCYKSQKYLVNDRASIAIDQMLHEKKAHNKIFFDAIEYGYI